MGQGHRLTALGLIETAGRSTLRNLSVFLVLSILYLLLLYPFLRPMAPELNLAADETMSRLMDGLGDLPRILLALLVNILVFTLFVLVWSRCILAGAKGIFLGGAGKFFSRWLWVVVRYFDLITYVLIIPVPLAVAAGFAIGLYVAPDGRAVAIAALYPFLMLLFAVIMMIFLVSAIAASTDDRLSMRDAWKLCEGERVRLLISMALLYAAGFGLTYALASILFPAGAAAGILSLMLPSALSGRDAISYFALNFPPLLVFGLVVAILAESYQRLTGSISRQQAEETF